MNETPRLLEDQTRNDFADSASYECSITHYIDKCRLVISNELIGMEWLQSHIDRGDAAWIAELRIPRALYSLRRRGKKGEDIVLDYENNDPYHNAYAISMLCVENRFSIAKEHLSPAWNKLSSVTGKVTVQSGGVLIQSSMHAINFSENQFIAFKKDSKKDPCLEGQQKGAMKMVESGQSSPLFHAVVSDDVFDAKEQNPILWGHALSHALGKLQREKGSWGKSEYALIKETLTGMGLDDSWENDNFSPEFWATKWEPLRLNTGIIEGEE